MSEFDPRQPAILHDALNEKFFDWKPEWKEHWDEHAQQSREGVIGWDGLLIDGWLPADAGAAPPN